MRLKGFRVSERYAMAGALGFGIGLVSAGVWLRWGMPLALVCAGVGVCFDLWLGAILARKAGI